MKTGANIFLTGEPGSGKTYTVNAYIEYLRAHSIEPSITASTGIAATHIGGMTIHAWSGIGIKKVLTVADLDDMLTRERLVKRVSRAKVLIIDEISMLDAETLTAVDLACRTLRGRKTEAFGGLQVIFVGDFFQLPPVSRDRQPARFAFMSNAWKEARPLVCYLSEQHRQADSAFLALLASVRSGRAIEDGAITDDIHDMLSARVIQKTPAVDEYAEGDYAEVEYGDGTHSNGAQNSNATATIEAEEISSVTRLYSHNINVDQVNEQHLAQLSGKVVRYTMEAHGSEGLIMQLKKGCLSPEILSLKIGAHVMFTKNSPDEGFVNGTIGTVNGFNLEGNPIVRVGARGAGRPIGSRSHGSSKGERDIEVAPMEWAIMDGQRTLARIKQIPLRLAWAMTIHKSQGVTLDEAVIDLSKTFEYGQGYVALSRVRTLEGLSLIGYNTRALEVHPQIIRVDSEFKIQSDAASKIFTDLQSPEKAGPDGDYEKMRRNFILGSGGKIEADTPAEVAKKRTKIAAKKAEKSSKKSGEPTHMITFTLFKENKTLAEMAETRGLTVGTIIGHLEILLSNGDVKLEELSRLIPEKLVAELPTIHAMFVKMGSASLPVVFHKLDKKYPYEDLRLARLVIKA